MKEYNDYINKDKRLKVVKNCKNKLNIFSSVKYNFLDNMSCDKILEINIKDEIDFEIYNFDDLNFSSLNWLFDNINEINCNINFINGEGIEIIKTPDCFEFFYLFDEKIRPVPILDLLPNKIDILYLINNDCSNLNKRFPDGLQNLPSSLTKIIFCILNLSCNHYINSPLFIKKKFLLKSKIPFNCEIFLTYRESIDKNNLPYKIIYNIDSNKWITINNLTCIPVKKHISDSLEAV